MHTERREEGELSVERFGELWAASQAHDARRLGRDHRGLPHVVVVHPALHRDAGLRVRVRVRPAARAVGLRAVRGARAPASSRSTSTCCARAGRWRRRSSASSSTSTSPIPGSGTAASTSSSAVSTRRSPPPRPRAGWHDVPRHPVEHRQRRSRRAALHHPPSRPRARRACGCTRPTRPGKDAGELCGLAPTGVLATNDADALLALDADCVSYTATADLRPMEAITDISRASCDRARTWCRARSWPRSTRRTSTRRCANRSRTRASRVASSCFTSGIDPGWANDCLAARARRDLRVRRAAPGDGDRQLQALRAADGAVRHDGVRQAARREAVAAVAGRAVVRLGRSREGARRRPRRRDRRAASRSTSAGPHPRRSTSASASSSRAPPPRCASRCRESSTVSPGSSSST